MSVGGVWAIAQVVVEEGRNDKEQIVAAGWNVVKGKKEKWGGVSKNGKCEERCGHGVGKSGMFKELIVENEDEEEQMLMEKFNELIVKDKVGDVSDKNCGKMKWGKKAARSICTVEKEKPWMPVGSGEITVDSAAEESVCPKVWGEAYAMRMPSKWPRLVNASGGPMGQ